MIESVVRMPQASEEGHSTNSPKVDIVILNWNGWPDTIECLESLRQLTYPDYRIVLIDNGSTDESVERIRTWCLDKIPSQQLILIQTGENLGFAGGNNVALEYGLREGVGYFWLLNNDTVLDPQSLTELIDVVKSDPSIGLAGPLVLFYRQPRSIYAAGLSISKVGRRVRRIGLGQAPDDPCFQEPRDVEGLAGCALFVRREVLQTVGLFDERYFLYMEEVDLCTRAIQNHFRCVLVPRARIWHKGWGSVKNDPGLMEYYLARSQILYLRKFSSGGRYVLDVFAYVFRSFWQAMLRTFREGHLICWMALFLGLAHGLSGRYTYSWHGNRVSPTSKRSTSGPSEEPMGITPLDKP